jgi:CRISPR-associated DxTHG motif protein
VPIETGRDTAEMWQTFKVITDQVNEGDTVTFDITHGLRSLPFLVFLFAAYLKAAKGVIIDAIYYGALELGDARNGVPAPVIDLSDFVTMLDWISATDRFVQTGSSEALSDLLLESRPGSLAMRDDLHQRDMGRQLKNSGTVIDQISLALSITRPLETMKASARLGGYLAQLEPVLAERAQPFGVLVEKVRTAYAPFGLHDPSEVTTLKENLWIQIDMVAWYIDKAQYVQAATLSREVTISLVCYCVGETDLTDLDMRLEVEDAINNLRESRKASPRPPRNISRFDANTASLLGASALVDLWNKMSGVRNDIAHCGFNKRALSADELVTKVRNLQPDLEKLANTLIGTRSAPVQRT